MQLVKGILIIVIGLKVAQLIRLRTLAFILEGAISLFGFFTYCAISTELRRVWRK